MKKFAIALQFLTRLPIRISGVNPGEIGRSIVYFPVVGALIGILLAGLDLACGAVGLNGLASSVIVVIALVCVTGAIHLDGLADSCDAFFSGKGRDEMLAIMRDPHIGTMGVTSLVAVILLKVSLLSALAGPLRTTAIVVMCVMGRWAMVFAMQISPYARSEGKAKHFLGGTNRRLTWVAAGITIVLVEAAWHANGAALFLAITGITYLFTASVRRRLGGITGDTIGATDEIVETATLLVMCIGAGGYR